MSVSGISSGSFAAIAAGVRGQMQAQLVHTVLREAGLLDQALHESLAASAELAHDLTDAGVARMHNDLVGTMIDVLA